MNTIQRPYGCQTLLTLFLIVFFIVLSAAPSAALWSEEEEQLQARENKIISQKQEYEQKYGTGKNVKDFDDSLKIIAGERARLHAEKQLAAENKILMDKVAYYLKSKGFKVELSAKKGNENRIIQLSFSKENIYHYRDRKQGNDLDIRSGFMQSSTYRYETGAAGNYDYGYKQEVEKKAKQEINKLKKETRNSLSESGPWTTISQSIDLLQELSLSSAKAFFSGKETSSENEYYNRSKVKLPEKSFNAELSYHFGLKLGALIINIYYNSDQRWTDDTCCLGNNNVTSAEKVFRLTENKYPGAQWGIELAKFIDAAMKEDVSVKPAAQTKLIIEPTILEVKPDGVNQTAINFFAAAKSAEPSASLLPAANADIQVEIMPDQGKILGNLSTPNVLTGPDGKAQLVYTAPAKELWQVNKPERIEIKVKSEKLGITDTLYVSFLRENKLNILARHAILPAHRDFENNLTISFEDPRKDWGKKYQAVARCSSKDGRIIVNGKESTEISLELLSGAPNSISYRWAGEQPVEKAVEEKIEITIPDLGLQEKINFSVGIDLIIDSALADVKGPLHPNMFIPFKVYIRDRFHPDADLGTLFKDFGIEPQLAIEQISYAPIATGSLFSERFLQNFVKSIEGAVIPHGHLARDISPGFGRVLKDKDGRWLLVNRYAEPADHYPGVIPFDMGNYLFQIKLIPGWKGDAGVALQDISLQLAVEDIKPEEEMFLTFLLPTMQAYVALYPGMDAFALTAKITTLVYEGKYKTAVRELAKELLFSKIGEKGGEIINAELIKILEKKLPKATFEKLAAKLQMFKEEDGADFLIDQLNLDIVGALAGSLVDGLEEATIGKIFNDDENTGQSAKAAESNNKESTNADQQKELGSILYLKEIMAGSKDYGVILIPRKGISSITATGGEESALREAPSHILEGGDPAERIHKNEQVYALPFRAKETLTLSMEGNGKAPVRIIKITPEGVASKTYSQPGGWKKKLTIK